MYTPSYAVWIIAVPKEYPLKPKSNSTSFNAASLFWFNGNLGRRGADMSGEKIKGVPYAEVKAKALRNKDVLAAYEKAKREDDPHVANALRLFKSTPVHNKWWTDADLSGVDPVVMSGLTGFIAEFHASWRRLVRVHSYS